MRTDAFRFQSARAALEKANDVMDEWKAEVVPLR
jgi:hypothetical protein